MAATLVRFWTEMKKKEHFDASLGGRIEAAREFSWFERKMSGFAEEDSLERPSPRPSALENDSGLGLDQPTGRLEISRFMFIGISILNAIFQLVRFAFSRSAPGGHGEKTKRAEAAQYLRAFVCSAALSFKNLQGGVAAGAEGLCMSGLNNCLQRSIGTSGGKGFAGFEINFGSGVLALFRLYEQVWCERISCLPLLAGRDMFAGVFCGKLQFSFSAKTRRLSGSPFSV